MHRLSRATFPLGSENMGETQTEGVFPQGVDQSYFRMEKNAAA